MKKFIFALLSGLLFLFSCKKEEVQPSAPVISFNRFEKYKSAIETYKDSLNIVLNFEDGDGDIGLSENERDIKNFYSKIYYKFHDTLQSNESDYRIPYLLPSGKKKAIKGEIKLSLNQLPPGISDSVYFSIYIQDRQFHLSNTIITPKIFVTNKYQ